MTTRLPLAALALLALTAFAPAPFSRPERDRKAHPLSLQQLQGVWYVVKLETTRSTGTHVNGGTNIKEVHVAGRRWSFVYTPGGGGDAVTYNITVDHQTKPPRLDFHYLDATQGQAPYGTGILKREGDRVLLMYNWKNAHDGNFETPPDGHWLITLARAR